MIVVVCVCVGMGRENEDWVRCVIYTSLIDEDEERVEQVPVGVATAEAVITIGKFVKYFVLFFSSSLSLFFSFPTFPFLPPLPFFFLIFLLLLVNLEAIFESKALEIVKSSLAR